jgi:hypothetical protein
LARTRNPLAPLAFLSPRIIAAIVDGAAPSSHTKGTHESVTRRNGNWKMALRDRRPKLAPQGRRRDYADIPKAVSDLVDDPFRSLAGELRLAGGYAKDTTPFSEFLWADFLRRRMKRQNAEKDFDAALEEVLKLAKGTDSDYLPGWCGPINDN